MYVFSPQHLILRSLTGPCDVGQVTIDTLSDDALLYVFDFYVAQTSKVEAWHTLVHVCRRWRALVFASSRRLNLRIACTKKTRVREKLDIWPALPIVVLNESDLITPIHNIEAALKLNDRVCQISLFMIRGMDKVFAALEQPFPALTDLHLFGFWDQVSVSPNPAKFLGGSTNLRSLSVLGIPIQGLPKLLLSSTNLVHLRLNDIPTSGFFSPDAIVTALSALTRLKVLYLDLNKSYPDWESRHLPLPPPTILPSLTALKLIGATEYLEDLLARIDVPLLDHLDIKFTFFYFDQAIVLDTPQLLQFISRTPKLQAPDKARIAIDDGDRNFQIEIWRPGQISSIVKLEIPSNEPERQLPCLAQFCPFPLSPLPTLECVYIDGGAFPVRHQRGNAGNTRWLEPFTSVKNLFLSKDFALNIAHALEGLDGEGAMEVLPTLENVFIEEFQPSGSVHGAFEQLVAERQLSGRPIVVSCWNRQGAGKNSDDR
jgi:hypothetical protein